MDYLFLSFKRLKYFWLKLRNYLEKDSSTSFISRHSRNSITKKLLGVILLAFLINHIFPPFFKRTLHSILFLTLSQSKMHCRTILYRLMRNHVINSCLSVQESMQLAFNSGTFPGLGNSKMSSPLHIQVSLSHVSSDKPSYYTEE